MRSLIGLGLVLLGAVAIGLGIAAMFAEGIRADETGTAGALNPLDMLLTLGGMAAVAIGLSFVYRWYAAKRGPRSR